MTVEFLTIGDASEFAGGHEKKVLFASKGFHTWVHRDEPGTKGPMHRHTADQTFYCIEGECTFHFPEGASHKLEPGMIVHIGAGEFYQLENTGTGPLVMLGNRAEDGRKPRFSPTGKQLRKRTAPQVDALERAKAKAAT